MSRLRRSLPLLVVTLGALALGAWQNQVGLAEPVVAGPRTPFTSGHYVANAIAAAQIRIDGYPSTSTPLVGWPHVADFRTVMWPAQLLGVFVGPLVSVNLFFAGTYALNALAGYALGRATRLPPAGAAVVAGLAAFNPWARETLTNGQLEQALLAAPALVWASAAWAVGRADRASLLVPPAVVLLAALAAPHLTLAACLGLGAWAALDVVRHRERAGRWAALLAGGAIAAFVAEGYHAPNFTGGVRVFFPKGSGAHPSSVAGLPDVATLQSLLWPPADHHRETGTLHPTWLGWTALAAAVAGTWRSRSPVALGVAATLAVLALGSHLQVGGVRVPLPFAAFGLLSEAVVQSASAYRMVGGAVVALALAAGALVRTPGAALALVVVAWAETAAFGTRPLRFERQDFYRDAEHRAFRAREGAVLDLPVVSQRCPTPAYHYLYEATFRHRPTPVLVYAPAVYPTLPALHRRLLDATGSADCALRLPALVHDLGFSAVVLHAHDRECPVPPRLVQCLNAAFGPGEAAAGMRWWDPLPPLPEEARRFQGPPGPPAGGAPRGPP